MRFFDRIKKMFQSNDSSLNNVRIEEPLPFQTAIGIDSEVIWIQNDNISDSLAAIEKFDLKYLQIQSSTIDFLADERLKNIKGITIQYSCENMEVLYKHTQLTHLHLPETTKTEFDFSPFTNLIYLGGTFPKKFKHFDKLENLKYTNLFKFKNKDFSLFSTFRKLQKLEMRTLNCESLKGLGSLQHLQEIVLDQCPRLETLDGIGEQNSNLKTMRLTGCKRLKDATSIGVLPKLEDLLLQNILQLDSFNFLNQNKTLKKLIIHPASVGVKNEDYYPLISKLKELGLLNQIKSWKKLDQYSDPTKAVEAASENLTELQLILKNLSIRNWPEKLEFGLEVYTEKNCNKAVVIFEELINDLEGSNQLSEKEKIALIQKSVLQLNDLDLILDNGFIETGEREELCDIFDNIADSVGIDVTKFEDGIASEWREW